MPHNVRPSEYTSKKQTTEKQSATLDVKLFKKKIINIMLIRFKKKTIPC